MTHGKVPQPSLRTVLTMPIAEQEWSRAVDVLGGAPSVALACHVDPDGDALGSMLAFAQYLKGRGVDVAASWGTAFDAPDDLLVVPAQYAFLPALDLLRPPAQFPSDPEVMVAFDTGSAERLGSLSGAAAAAQTLIVLDHHASGEPFGDVRLLDGDAPATAVLVDELIRRLGGDLDRDMATCLYVALLTDTGGFQYASTTPGALELAARLVSYDIDHSGISRQVYATHSFGYLKVLGRALERARLVPEVGLVWTAIRQEDLEEFGVAWHETEGLIDVVRGVEAGDCVMVLKQQEDGSWKASLRSRGGVDVGTLARALGGGGHAMLGGFTCDDSLEAILERVVSLLADQPERVGVGG